MASLPKSENHSLRYHFLDNGVNSESRNQPMASAEFGAESGAYFLQSAPETFPSPLDMNQYQEYQLEPDPHAIVECPTIKPTTGGKTKRKKQKKISGAQVASPDPVSNEAVAPTNNAATCSVVRWETLPTCLIESVLGVTRDLTQLLLRSTPENRQPLGDIFTKNSRLTYLLILFLLLFFVYRIFRR